MSESLLPAVADVEVIETNGLSDHHAVLARLDRELLLRILAPDATRS